jgi:hypothetical protein
MKLYQCFIMALIAGFSLNIQNSFAQEKPRTRDLGIPFHGTPGPLGEFQTKA